MTGPLDRVKVVDLTANMSGPYATMILAEQGADVVKIEPPGGEIIRRVGSGRRGMSAYFENLNHGKRSVVVDLRSERGVDVVRRLTKTSDVLVQNFRPGIIERMGLGAETLRSEHPELIYVSISGYGRVGPLAETPAYDHVVQAMTGMAALQADPHDGIPSLIRHGIVDKATGLTVAQAVTAALLERARTGEGGVVDVAMLDVALHFFWPDGMMNNTCLEPVDAQPAVARGFRLTKVADGYVSLVTVTDQQWEGLVAALGMQDRLSDPDLKGTEARMRNGGRVMRDVAARLELMDTSQVVALLREHGVPCMAVAELSAVAEDEQVQAAGSLFESDHPVLGRITGPRPPARFGLQETTQPTPAPQPGADTDEVLKEIGFSGSEIADLRSGGEIA
jgi:crotonobetainyl-CoA:carnitine CoA-transferase CaiB-like acyl-CoA transferase